MNSLKPIAIAAAMTCFAILVNANLADAQTTAPALLILEKADNMLAIADPATMKIVARVPAGPDPHEIVVSSDGKLAYISNYGGLDSNFNTITVIDLAAQKALAPIQLAALRSAHGLAFAGGKLYFTVETNKAFGRYDRATNAIDWVLGTGQDRTHMIVVAESLDRIFTSNVSSGTISVAEQVEAPTPPGPPPGSPAATGPPGGPRKTWKVSNIPSGRGAEGFDLSPDGKEIWAANAQDGTVTVIDVASKKATSTFPVSVHGNRLKFVPDGQRVLISGGSPGGSGANFAVIDVASHKEVKTLNMGGGSAGILIVPDGSRAFVAIAAANKVALVDLQKMAVVGELPTGKGPEGLAWRN